MAEYQRIHPVTIEPSAPAASPDRLSEPSKSHRTDQLPVFQPADPPPQVAVPLPPPNKRRQRSCCCRCLCWSLLTLILLVVAVASTAGIVYLVFRPKIPHYSVDRLTVSAFNIDANQTVSATFNVTVTARNPNKRIGIYYEEGSSLSAWFNTTELCSGAFPAFYQGHRNTTVVGVVLSGETLLDNALLAALQRQEQVGSIPLTVRGDVPVRIKLGALRLWKMTARPRCSLVVDSLTSGNSIRIRSDSCKIKLKIL